MAGMAGIVNLGLLRNVGYYAYRNWDRQRDRRTISAAAVSLLTLAGPETNTRIVVTTEPECELCGWWFSDLKGVSVERLTVRLRGDAYEKLHIIVTFL
ncbi:hypothetical protein BD410DRAFT_286440 [Rickenella mellea]|uniref:Uncharacterized protein n=1 Tax=Rickenella mellea TaxID=50990 RepID=A0A4Y7Q408_9AGAM|nr:hypothetical protein BD410DRAFT_286440 [Rickenella mellea]